MTWLALMEVSSMPDSADISNVAVLEAFSTFSEVCKIAILASLLCSTWLTEVAFLDSDDETTCAVLLLAITSPVNWFCVTAAVELWAES